jgi:hypothetical protein
MDDDPDRPLPEDVAALDFSDLAINEEDEEPLECSAMVPAGPTVSRPCRKPTHNLFAHSPVTGLTIWFALCDEHVQLLDELRAVAEND